MTMLGVIYSQYKKYICSVLGTETWQSVLNKAEAEDIEYNPTIPYPDELMLKLFEETALITEKTLFDVEEEFGCFLGTQLVHLFNNYLKPEWKTLDLLENTEHNIHHYIRNNNTEATPPELKTKRANDNKVTIHYHSHRKLLRLAIGIVKGIATHFNEHNNIEVTLASYAKGYKNKISVRYKNGD